jgi:2-polyprenyl-3-methyl-5-hydroxy-6-metoxy-1,4-benzoquinol methylase
VEYFELRGIDADVYANAELPAWLFEQVAAAPPTANILDFGCGFGQNIQAIKKHGFANVCGADVNPHALKHCKAVGIEAFDVSTGFDELIATGKRFDFIVTTHVLEHIPKEQVVGVLTKLRGLLSKNGAILVAVPNAQAYTGCYWAYEDFTHHTLYTTGSLLFVLRAAGFSKIELLDRNAVAGSKFLRRTVRLGFAALYRVNYGFWKKILGSPTHISSIDVFTYELKMRAEA